MHDFLQDEAIGANRALQMAEAQRLLGGDGRNADDLYDDEDFFANLPKDGEDVDRQSTFFQRMPSGRSRSTFFQRLTPTDVEDVEDEEKQVGSDQGSMQHEGDGGDSMLAGSGGGSMEEERKTLASAGPPQLPGQLIARRPTIDYSQEQDMVAGFRPNRSDRVKNQYLRTFWERSRAIGGGASGFFGALFGRGMRRANDAAAARARREAEKARQAQRPEGLRSALRTRLANEGAVRADGVEHYPQEPGVAYDDAAARKTRQAFADARRTFGRIARPQEGFRNPMSGAHAEYDLATGTRFQGTDATTTSHSDDKFSELMRVNEQFGADAAQEEITPHIPRPRLRNALGAEKQVRFKDGGNDAVGFGIGRGPKPRPTGVRFHPIDVESDAASPAISDEEAMAQERVRWPIHQQMWNLGDSFAVDAKSLSAGNQARRLAAANPAPGSAEEQKMQEGLTVEDVGVEVSNKLRQTENERTAKRREHFNTAKLGQFNRYRVRERFDATNVPKGVDEQEDFAKRFPHLRADFFRDTYFNAYDQRIADAQAAAAEGNGNGGGGLIEEEIKGA